jgi:hypothetical protein
VAVKKIDHETNLLFGEWLKQLVNSKLEGKSTTSIQDTINRKLAEIYTLTETEFELVFRSESIESEVDSSIINISELVRS